MNTYTVSIPKVIWLTATIEAEDEDTAIDHAFDLAPGLCVRCSGLGREWRIEEDDWGGIQDVAPQFAVTADLVSGDE